MVDTHKGTKIAVVIPTYKARNHILGVITAMDGVSVYARAVHKIDTEPEVRKLKHIRVIGNN